MENTNTTRQLNNKGFTLIEILVALAVSGIVVVMIAALMTNGSFLFKNENSKINMQNELQMIDSFLTETILEAKALYISEDQNKIQIYTGEKDANGQLVPMERPVYNVDATTEAPVITTERILTYAKTAEKQGVYITKSFVDLDSLSKGYLVSGCVTTFNVSVDDACKATDEDGNTYYKNPIVLNVEIEVSDSDKTKTQMFTYRLRNPLSNIYINGTEYEVK